MIEKTPKKKSTEAPVPALATPPAPPVYISDYDDFPVIEVTPYGARSVFEKDRTERKFTLVKRKLWASDAPAPCPEFIAVQTLRQLRTKEITGEELSRAERFAGDIVSEAIRKNDAPAFERMARSLKFLNGETEEKSQITRLRELALRLTAELERKPAQNVELKKAAVKEGIISKRGFDAKHWLKLIKKADLNLPTCHLAKGNRWHP